MNMKLVKSKKNGIKQNLLIFGLILSISVSFTGLKSQSISTIGEIYNYEIGDIFHFNFLAYSPGSGYGSITNIEILNKYYSQNNDTLFYIRDIDFKSSSSENPEWTYDYYIDTIFYFNLDSLINMGQIDSVGTDVDLYNGRLINYITTGTGEEDIYSKRYVNGCGRSYNNYRTWGGLTEATTELVYYKKGNEEWGTPMLVSIYDNESNNPDLIVYPNPAKSTINIMTNDVETIELKIIALSGELVKTLKLSAESKTIDISQLSIGIYILEIKKNDRIIYKKLIKE